MKNTETLPRPSQQQMVRTSPRQRLESALRCIKNARVRLQVRRIYETEIPTASIFWDEDERQVELIANDWEIIIRERTDTGSPNAELSDSRSNKL